MRRVTYIAALLFALVLGANANVLLAGPGLEPGKAPSKCSQHGLSALHAAMTGLVPPADSDASAAAAVQRASAFGSPVKAGVFVHIVGMGKEMMQKTAAIFEGKNSQEVEVEPSHIVSAFQAVAEANADVKVTPLDRSAMHKCCDACLEKTLTKVAGLIGAAYAPSTGKPLTGTLTLSGGVVFDLTKPADKALAVELAELYGAAAAQSRGAEGLPEDIQAMETTLTALQEVAAAYGRDSAQYAAAADALVATLRAAVAQLDSTFGGAVAYSVAALGDAAPAGARAAAGGSQQRRRLAQYDGWYGDVDEPTAARKFSAKAAGYGAFLFLLYFGIAGVWCMCNMKFKEDTILYPRQKAE